MKRYLEPLVAQDLRKKMVFVTGPRQVGKTTLAQQIGASYQQPLYLNYDSLADRLRIEAGDWNARQDYLVLDEIHSMPNWKQYLKGAFDAKPKAQALLVTGSARLDTFRQAGKSLAGRYFRWRLHPVSVKEHLVQEPDSEQALANLERFGGFPEPLLEATDAARKRWQALYYSDLLREDILEFSRIHEIKAMRQLLELLRTRTGSPLSFDSLGRDLGVAANTARSYVSILEALHIVFLVTPYSHNIARAQVKAAKLYFYDWAYVIDTPTHGGAQFENLVASHLLKHVQFQNDGQGKQLELKYVRTSNGKEIDFVIADENGDALEFIEVKLSDEKPSFAIKQVAQNYPEAKSIQVVRNARNPFVREGVSVEPAAQWLAKLT
jgi:uncharacterized protein